MKINLLVIALVGVIGHPVWAVPPNSQGGGPGAQPSEAHPAADSGETAPNDDYAMGQKLYQQGRLNEALNSFEKCILNHQHVKESVDYSVLIGKEFREGSQTVRDTHTVEC